MTYEKQIKDNIKDNIIRLRKASGLTQDMIARALELKDASTYRSWETGRSSPKSHMLYKLAKIYNVSVDDILSKDFENKAQTNLFEVRSESNYNVYGDKYLSELNNQEKVVIMRFRYLNKEDREKFCNYLDNLTQDL